MEPWLVEDVFRLAWPIIKKDDALTLIPSQEYAIFFEAHRWQWAVFLNVLPSPETPEQLVICLIVCDLNQPTYERVLATAISCGHSDPWQRETGISSLLVDIHELWEHFQSNNDPFDEFAKKELLEFPDSIRGAPKSFLEAALIDCYSSSTWAPEVWSYVIKSLSRHC